jgi:hypothetical protein
MSLPSLTGTVPHELVSLASLIATTHEMRLAPPGGRSTALLHARPPMKQPFCGPSSAEGRRGSPAVTWLGGMPHPVWDRVQYSARTATRATPAWPAECRCVRLAMTFMDNSPVAGMGALWTELPEQRRPFEIVLVVPREDKGEPLVPRTLPPEVLGCWSAHQVIVSAIVLASGPTAAIAAVEALIPDLTRAAGAAVKVRAADARGKTAPFPARDATTGSSPIIGG